MKNTIKMSLVAALAVAGLSSTASADYTILEPQDMTIKMSKVDSIAVKAGPAIAMVIPDTNIMSIYGKKMEKIGLNQKQSGVISQADNDSGGDANMLSQTDMPKKSTKMMSLAHADNVASGVAGALVCAANLVAADPFGG